MRLSFQYKTLSSTPNLFDSAYWGLAKKLFFLSFNAAALLRLLLLLLTCQYGLFYYTHRVWISMRCHIWTKAKICAVVGRGMRATNWCHTLFPRRTAVSFKFTCVVSCVQLCLITLSSSIEILLWAIACTWPSESSINEYSVPL